MHFPTVDVVTQTRCVFCVCVCALLQIPFCWYTLSACARNERFYPFGRSDAALAVLSKVRPKDWTEWLHNKRDGIEPERICQSTRACRAPHTQTKHTERCSGFIQTCSVKAHLPAFILNCGGVETTWSNIFMKLFIAFFLFQRVFIFSSHIVL